MVWIGHVEIAIDAPRVQTLRTAEVCLGHRLALKLQGGVLTFDLDRMPDLLTLQRAVQREQMRRAAEAAQRQQSGFYAQYMRQMQQEVIDMSSGFIFTANSTGSTSHIQWG